MPFPFADVSAKSLSDLLSLAGRRAIVTGGARGLGKAIALRLAEGGADVIIADIDADLAREAAADVAGRHATRAEGVAMDVTDSGSVARAAQAAVDAFGGVDIWINNAGIFPAVPVLQMPDETWEQVFAVNTRGVFYGSREAARRMQGDGGVIVNVVSTAGFQGTAPGLSAYVGSKHAVRGMTKQMALELAPQGIRVLGVAPTFVPTEGNMAAAAAGAAALEAQGLDPASAMPVMAQSLIGRIGTPDDIARVVLFAASDMSVIMTGSTLLADAGQTI
ncbi:MAG: bacC 4 [Microbacterium sp.]|jgi:NAD(P)-dependent dehydrogenase (short-subunit alcohol dehydrogenase family)|nr:bacC 4 [Microbacterium sp.]